MASMQTGSSEFSKAPKKDKKSHWTNEEEEALLEALKGLVVAGWKSDNGFRGGYMKHLEIAMRKAFPTANIKESPHIESKLTTWKKTYSTLTTTILSKSGVGFNLKGDNKIDATDEVWDEITKPDSTVKNWRSKSWPYLASWKEVFGKDRATGDGAADFMYMVNDLIQDDKVPSTKVKNGEDCNVNLEDEIPSPAAEDNVGQSTYENAKSSTNPKKRKLEDSISSLVDLVGDIHKNNSAKYELFSSRLGYQAAVNKSKANWYPLPQMIPGLTIDDMFDVGEKLLKEPVRLEVFMGLPEEARPAYVHRLMGHAT